MLDIIFIVLLVAYVGISIWSFISSNKAYKRYNDSLDRDINLLDDFLHKQKENIKAIHYIALKLDDIEKSLFGEVIEDEDRRG